MKWSFLLARIAGIEVRIHYTFFLLLAFYGAVRYQDGGIAGALAGVLFICLLFLCVVLHEFGHAFAARLFGIRTPDITLLPIGGVARMERIPKNPFEELVVALAGPAVNVCIAFTIWYFIGGVSLMQGVVNFDQPGDGLLARIMGINLALVLFNMIPAFPMDGGRVLRALLAMKFSHGKATMIAARIGQVIAVLFALVGIFVLGGNILLVFIAMFVFLGAQQELLMARIQLAAPPGMRVGELMITNMNWLPDNITISEACQRVMLSLQPIFPVVDDALLVKGMVMRDEILKADEAREEEPLQAIVVPVVVVRVDQTCEEAIDLMQQHGMPVLPVVDAEKRLAGLISINSLLERSRHQRKA